MSSSDSSSSFCCWVNGGSSMSGPAASAGTPSTTSVAVLPAPTSTRSSFTFLPSSAFATSDAQIGSRSTEAADVTAKILSDCERGECPRRNRPDSVSNTYRYFDAIIRENEGCVNGGVVCGCLTRAILMGIIATAGADVCPAASCRSPQRITQDLPLQVG